MRASERAYRALRSEIIDWRRPPGSVLGEVELAEQLGVSRTPVREAISRLLGDGLAAPRAGRGAVVAPVSARGVREMFELRVALDVQAAGLAARRADPAVFERLAERLDRARAELSERDADRGPYYALVAALDEAIDDAADSAWLRQAQEQLRAHLGRVRRLSQHDAERLRAAAQEHAEIARAIAAGDVGLAEASTRVHLHRSLTAILRAIARQETGGTRPSPFPDLHPMEDPPRRIERI